MKAAPSSEDIAWPDDAVEVGRVLDAYGLKGWIKVQSYSSTPEALYSSRRWFVQPPQDDLPGPSAQARRRVLRVSQAKSHAGNVVAAVQDVGDRDQAQALRGWHVYVSRGSFPTAGADEYYWVDLVGLTVVNREGVALGTVTDLFDTGSHSVLRIEPPTGGDAAERLIPFVAAYIDAVSLEQRQIRVDWGVDY